MSQDTSFGKAELVTHMKVNKKDGRTFYYEVRNGVTTEITEADYLAAITVGDK